MTSADHTPVRAVVDVVVVPGPDGARLENPHGGTIVELNSTAYAIWSLCDGETSVGEIAEAISILTSLTYEAALAQATETIASLTVAGVMS